MPQFQLPFEAEIVHDLPDEIAATIGRVIVSYSKLEHKLSMISGLLLQLNKAEARIALRMPRAVDRLDMALDLFAIKDLTVRADVALLREKITAATTERDRLAHGLFLRHPGTGELYLRIARGQWPKDLALRQKISRAIYPQSIPFGPAECKAALDLVNEAMRMTDDLGAEVDEALRSLPDRFREPAPLLNQLGVRGPKVDEPRRE